MGKDKSPVTLLRPPLGSWPYCLFLFVLSMGKDKSPVTLLIPSLGGMVLCCCFLASKLCGIYMLYKKNCACGGVVGVQETALGIVVPSVDIQCLWMCFNQIFTPYTHFFSNLRHDIDQPLLLHECDDWRFRVAATGTVKNTKYTCWVPGAEKKALESSCHHIK